MIQTTKLLKTMNLPEDTFWIAFDTDNTPVLMSSYVSGRQVEPQTVNSEAWVLAEAENLLQNMVEGLSNEIEQIRAFRTQFYKDSSTANEEKSETGEDRSAGKE
jgi:hypothetical protein